MAVCGEAHARFDRIANAEGQVGELPPWLHVRGRAFWWVYQGPYEAMPDAWETFHAKGRAAGVVPAGPPGDVYVCDPDDHRDDPGRILTVMWVPVE